jgi:hypothetical protein
LPDGGTLVMLRDARSHIAGLPPELSAPSPVRLPNLAHLGATAVAASGVACSALRRSIIMEEDQDGSR